MYSRKKYVIWKAVPETRETEKKNQGWGVAVVGSLESKNKEKYTTGTSLFQHPVTVDDAKNPPQKNPGGKASWSRPHLQLVRILVLKAVLTW